jgi:hypothetical protein
VKYVENAIARPADQYARPEMKEVNSIMRDHLHSVN